MSNRRVAGLSPTFCTSSRCSSVRGDGMNRRRSADTVRRVCTQAMPNASSAHQTPSSSQPRRVTSRLARRSRGSWRSSSARVGSVLPAGGAVNNVSAPSPSGSSASTQAGRSPLPCTSMCARCLARLASLGSSVSVQFASCSSSVTAKSCCSGVSRPSSSARKLPNNTRSCGARCRDSVRVGLPARVMRTWSPSTSVDLAVRRHDIAHHHAVGPILEGAAAAQRFLEQVREAVLDELRAHRWRAREPLLQRFKPAAVFQQAGSPWPSAAAAAQRDRSSTKGASQKS